LEGIALELAIGVDNQKTLVWLESALEYAFMERRPELWAYLEAVMEEVLFEMDEDIASKASLRVRTTER
jgi:hypothetical protein